VDAVQVAGARDLPGDDAQVAGARGFGGPVRVVALVASNQWHTAEVMRVKML